MPGIVHDMPSVADGTPPWSPDVTLTASGDQAHQSVMQVHLVWLGSQERWTDVPMTP
jgi:hypothetical protein